MVAIYHDHQYKESQQIPCKIGRNCEQAEKDPEECDRHGPSSGKGCTSVSPPDQTLVSPRLAAFRAGSHFG